MAGYPGYINPYLQSVYPQTYQTPQYPTPYPVQTAYPQQVQQQIQQAQSMTPPTIHAEIIQVKSADEVERFPVNAGTTQLFQIADDSAFVTKTVYADGQTNIDIYAKQPKKPVPPPIDPAQFVTWDALGDALDKWAAGRETGKGKRKRQDEAEAAQES